MKTINLGVKTIFKAIVDDEDYDKLKKYNWYKVDKGSISYAYTMIEGHRVYMHQLILPPKDGYVTDHVHRNGLDNRREGLRYATRSQNAANSRSTLKTSSGYKGVSWSKIMKKWESYINVNGRKRNLGYYKLKEEAALAYNKAALRYFGEFACLNEIKDVKS